MSDKSPSIRSGASASDIWSKGSVVDADPTDKRPVAQQQPVQADVGQQPPPREENRRQPGKFSRICCGGCACQGCRSVTSWWLFIGACIILGAYIVSGAGFISAWFIDSGPLNFYRTKNLPQSARKLFLLSNSLFWITNDQGKKQEAGTNSAIYANTGSISSKLFFSSTCGTNKFY